MGELETKKEFLLPLPVYPESALKRQPAYEKMIKMQQANTMSKLLKKKDRLENEIQLSKDNNTINTLEENLIDLANEIIMAEYNNSIAIKVPLTEDEKGEWRINEKAYSERLNKHITNQQKAFAIIIGQCTQRLQDKMHDDQQWETINRDQKPVKLYSLIERVIMKQTGDEYPPNNLVEHLLAVLSIKQQTNMSNAEWYEKFNTRVDVAESVGVKFDSFEYLWQYCIERKGLDNYNKLNPDQQSIIRLESKERLLGYLLIKNSSPTTLHDTIRNNLLDSFIARRDEYPENRYEAITILNRYDDRKIVNKVPSEGTAFAQKGKKGNPKEKKGGKDNAKAKDTKDNYFADKECFVCGKKGHGAKQCPMRGNKVKSDDSTISSKSATQTMTDFGEKLKNANKQFAQLKAQMGNSEEASSDDEQRHVQFMATSILHKYGEYIEPKQVTFKQSVGMLDDLDLRKVILLDNQSTMSLFCNKKMVYNIRASDEKMTLQSNGGSMTVHMIADVGEDAKPVWFSEKAITNILSLKDVVERYAVSYNSNESAFIVHRDNRGLPDMLFKMHRSGLHYFYPNKKDFMFISTVRDNMLPYSKRQIAGAQKAKDLYASLAYPSLADFKWIIRSNQIKDCPVSVEDTEIATNIWGPDIAALKGKTTRKTPAHVTTDIVAVPASIRQLHRFVSIGIDVFFVNQTPFLLTLSRNICFTTVTHLTDRKAETIYKAFASTFTYYYQRGFQIMTVTADGEFKSIENHMLNLPGAPRLNLTAANEHEPYVERRIRTIKERVRAIRHSLPFNTVPTVIVTHMVFYVVKVLNNFPVKGGVSENYSPKTIMSGETIIYKQYTLPFGTYCQVHEEDKPRNSMAARSQGAISLGPSNNRQGGQKFYTLSTCKVIVRRSWTAIPMPDKVVKRINDLSQSQPVQVEFYDREYRTISDNTDEIDSNSAAYELPGDDHPNQILQITGVDYVEPEEFNT
ncbi:MAG: hypothetical protein ACRCZ9_01525, partial [Fusobacteriaceae bacterium]